jgi:hypothetical protein
MHFVVQIFKTRLFQTFCLMVVLSLSACALKANSNSSSSTDACITSGDIIVSNSGSDTVLVLNSDGSYKGVALTLTSNTESIYGVHWDAISNRLLVVVDGVDRVISVDPTTCAASEFVTDTGLTGNVRGITRLASGDVLVVETSNIERFLVGPAGSGVRITAGWPKALQPTGSGVDARSGGGFVQCGNSGVRTYDDNGTVDSAQKTSGIAGTTIAADCRELTSGNIAVAWSGTTDTIAIYDSTLTTTIGTYSNTGILSTPGGLAQRANGNILALDRVRNYIVELTETGVYVDHIGGTVLSTPEFIEVIP